MNSFNFSSNHLATPDPMNLALSFSHTYDRYTAEETDLASNLAASPMTASVFCFDSLSGPLLQLWISPHLISSLPLLTTS